MGRPKVEEKLSIENSDDQTMPYKGLEIQFLMQQVVVLDEVVEITAAAQCCQVSWVYICYDGM